MRGLCIAWLCLLWVAANCSPTSLYADPEASGGALLVGAPAAAALHRFPNRAGRALRSVARGAKGSFNRARRAFGGQKQPQTVPNQPGLPKVNAKGPSKVVKHLQSTYKADSWKQAGGCPVIQGPPTTQSAQPNSQQTPVPNALLPLHVSLAASLRNDFARGRKVPSFKAAMKTMPRTARQHIERMNMASDAERDIGAVQQAGRLTISYDEACAIYLYSHASGFYGDYNKAFYTCSWTDLEKFAPYSRLLLSALTHLNQKAPQQNPQPGRPMTVYRFQSFIPNVLEDLQRLAGAPDVPAYWYVTWNFLSTTTNKTMALDWLSKLNNKGMVYEIDVIEGAYIEQYSNVPAEAEVLLPCFTCYRVVSVQPGDQSKASNPGSTYWNIRMQQRPCNGATSGQGQNGATSGQRQRRQ